ncbi:MAG: alpha/beta fold hydrolase [Rhodothermaceae bacterium]
MKRIKNEYSLNLVFILLLLAFTFTVNSLRAETTSTELFDVTVSGKGNPVILIHGYASHKSVWDETVNYLNSDFECHVFQLAGFAGKKAVDEEEYLAAVRDGIAEYITKNKLGKATLVGHSMGGFLSLWIASEYPDLVKNVVSVDGLPFLSAVINPAATSESQMEFAKKTFRYDYDFEPGKQTLSDEQRKQMFLSMTIHKEKMDLLLDWTKNSDPKILNQAMFELMVTDIREDIANIKAPVLLFGAWIAYKNYGATRESTKNLYSMQYAKAKNFRIELTDKGKHFIMWDDFDWYAKTLKDFIIK